MLKADTAFVPINKASPLLSSIPFNPVDMLKIQSLSSLQVSSPPSFQLDATVDPNIGDESILIEKIEEQIFSSLLTPQQFEVPILKSLAATLEVDAAVIHNTNQFERPIVCGHRGAIYQSLENTCHSIKTAHQLGCEEVEIDVFLLKCGTLCVFHGSGGDQDPGKFEHYCTNMQGSVLDYTYDEIKQSFKFNPHYEEFGCGSDIIHMLEQDNECFIPTLEEVLLEAKKLGLTVKIELKGPNTAEPTLELVEALDMVKSVHFSSFDLSRIHRIRELRPQRCEISGRHIYKTGALFDEVPDNFIQMALDVDATEVHLKYSTCTKSRVNQIHDAGMDSMCWMRGPIGMKNDVTQVFYDVGNEDEVLFRVVMATGVKKMCVNKPDVLSRMLKL